MNKKVKGMVIGIIVVLIGVMGLGFSLVHQPATSSRVKTATNATVIRNKTSSSRVDRSSQTSTINDADVVGVWINHHNKEIHQKITFTADHKWKENQHHVTNIYSGTWKRIGHNQILLAPYNEKIHLYGDKYQTMKVLSYDHILNKQTN